MTSIDTALRRRPLTPTKNKLRAPSLWLRGAFLCVVVLSHSACSTVGYYAQSIGGHLGLMLKREPINGLLGDSATPPGLKGRLSEAVAIREFASAELGLPENGSYRSYVDLGRRFVVWSVVAAPELSLNPKTWCFPVAGCVSYRGYYDEDTAQRFAGGLRDVGYDVYVAGVRAYSTLGWFDDPITSAILAQPEVYLAGVIFHELAHQRLYVAGDSSFNEAFAVAVEREGVRRWLAAQRTPAELEDYRRLRSREHDFLRLVFDARDRLHAIYDGGGSIEERRTQKRQVFDALREKFRQTKVGWGGAHGYDAWFDRHLNNAKLASVATYYGLVPAFERLLAKHNGELEAFYAACEGLGELPADERDAALSELATESGQAGESAGSAAN